jgi:hypothetical protein
MTIDFFNAKFHQNTKNKLESEYSITIISFLFLKLPNLKEK